MVESDQAQCARLDRFRLGRTLGKGAQAKVKVGIDQDGREFALKIFDKSNPRFTQ